MSSGDCRVRACSAPVPTGDHCAEHDTAAVRAMSHPHVYVFEGRRIVLESSPWDAEEPRQPQVTTPPPGPTCALSSSAAGTPRYEGTARPCWAWCGRGVPGPGCHPGSVFAAPPTIPCLACGRSFFSCQHPGASCSDECSAFLRDLRALPPAEAAARWLSTVETEEWEERAAVLGEAARLAPTDADRRALAMIWSAAHVARAVAVTGAAAVVAAPVAHESGVQQTASERTSGGQVQLLLFGG